MFEGSRKDGMKVWMYSLPTKRKYEAVYRLVVVWEGGKRVKGSGSGRKEVEIGFEKFFEGNGVFVPARFEEWLRSVVPVIQESEKDVLGGKAVTSGVEIESTGVNGTKRRN